MTPVISHVPPCHLDQESAEVAPIHLEASDEFECAQVELSHMSHVKYKSRRVNASQ